MAWQFGDGFDLYAASTDMINGYWDSGTMGSFTLVAGRFAGSQAISIGGGGGAGPLKNSGANDAIHHIVVAFRQTAALGGATNNSYIQLLDGATGQCCIVFRADGSITLASATPTGTILATYTGAFTFNVWTAFEFEIVINNTTGRFRARKNGNPVDDFDSGAVLNTRPGANSYANRLVIGQSTSINSQLIDDLYWRSDASSVPWMGDIRCYTRMPASDQSVQFSHSTGTTNFGCVDESQQNTTTDYVFDSTPGDADFYGIAAIASTPVVTFMVTTRGYMLKSDAGTRTAAVQLKSGATTVASGTTVLTTSGWLWVWRMDLTDPATSTAWTPAGVNTAQIGPVVIA